MLIAAHEVVQESLGFSPFELVCGHTVRVPLKFMKERWLADEVETNLLIYVSQFKERLARAREMTKEHLKKVQTALCSL